jgi:GNAT superfamily N-acetyltransferase
MVHVTVVCGADVRIGAARQLQHRCWGSFFDTLEFLEDGHDGHALHFLVLHEETIIASARLCVHKQLRGVTEFHLYPMLDQSRFPGSYGCLNRLVVDAQYRGRGLATILDQRRIDTAKRLGCRTILGSWNQHSGEKRRQALLGQGFTNVSNGVALPDGGFGMSFPYAMRLGDVVSSPDSTDVYVDERRFNLGRSEQ